MMIRMVSTFSLVSLLMLVLYLPAAHPPERFISQLKAEHDLNAAFWGNDVAFRRLSRMLDWHAAARQSSPLPNQAATQVTSQVDAAMATQVADISGRLVNNPYFRSLDALLALATYRLVVLTDWLAYFIVFIAAALIDGAVRRIVKSKEFLQHSPEMLAVYVCGIIMLACGTVIAFVIPLSLHPLVLPSVPLAIGALSGLAIAHYHRRA